MTSTDIIWHPFGNQYLKLMPIITTYGITIHINVYCGQNSECCVLSMAVYIHYKALNV